MSVNIVLLWIAILGELDYVQREYSTLSHFRLNRKNARNVGIKGTIQGRALNQATRATRDRHVLNSTRDIKCHLTSTFFVGMICSLVQTTSTWNRRPHWYFVNINSLENKEEYIVLSI